MLGLPGLPGGGKSGRDCVDAHRRGGAGPKTEGAPGVKPHKLSQDEAVAGVAPLLTVLGELNPVGVEQLERSLPVDEPTRTGMSPACLVGRIQRLTYRIEAVATRTRT